MHNNPRAKADGEEEGSGDIERTHKCDGSSTRDPLPRGKHKDSFYEDAPWPKFGDVSTQNLMFKKGKQRINPKQCTTPQAPNNNNHPWSTIWVSFHFIKTNKDIEKIFSNICKDNRMQRSPRK